MNLVLFVAVAGFCVLLYALTRQHSQYPSTGQESTLALSELLVSLEQRQEALDQRLEKVDRVCAERLSALEQQYRDLCGIDREKPMDNLQPAHRIRSLYSGKYARVVAMSREGVSMEQIARSTGIGVGEVEVVVGLAKREAME